MRLDVQQGKPHLSFWEAFPTPALKPSSLAPSSLFLMNAINLTGRLSVDGMGRGQMHREDGARVLTARAPEVRTLQVPENVTTTTTT